jgi:hypothetical protein
MLNFLVRGRHTILPEDNIMSNQKSKTSSQVVRNQRVTLLELLDRLLDRGVVVKGEILLSVADVSLVYLNLGLLLSAVKTVEKAARRGDWGEAGWIPRQPSSPKGLLNVPQTDKEKNDVVSTPLSEENSQRKDSDERARAGTLPAAISNELNKLSETKTDIDSKNVEEGLVKLVLTLVDLIRKLMEKQAIRRIEEEQLSDREVEDVGNAFLLLDEKMGELKKKFGLKDEDLNLDLGPLGDLM